MAFRILPSSGTGTGMTSGSQPSFVPYQGKPNYEYSQAPVENSQPQQSFGQNVMQGGAGILDKIATFLNPDTTAAAKGAFNSVRENGLSGLNVLTQQREKPMGMFEKGLGYALNSLPFGSPRTMRIENGKLTSEPLFLSNTLLGAAGRELEGQVIANEGMNVLGRVASPVLNPLKNFLTSTLPAQFVKLALPEGAAAAKTTVERVARNTGTDLATDIVDRNVVGTGQGLLQRALKQLNLIPAAENAAKDTLETQVEKTAARIPGKVNLLDLVTEAVGKVKDRFKGSGSDIMQNIDNTAIKIVEDVGETGTWKDALKLRRFLDRATGGSEESAAIRQALKDEFSDSIREKLAQVSPELADLMKEEQFMIRLKEAAKTSAAKPKLSKMDLTFLTGGGLFGGPAGLASAGGAIAASKVPFSPLAMTLLANLMKRGGQAATSDAVPKVGARVLLNSLLNGYNTQGAQDGEEVDQNQSPQPTDSVPSNQIQF